MCGCVCVGMLWVCVVGVGDLACGDGEAQAVGVNFAASLV